MKKNQIPLSILLAGLISAGFLIGCQNRAVDDIKANDIHIDLFMNENVQVKNGLPVVAVLDIVLTTDWSVLKEAATEKAHIEASHQEKMENGLLQNGFLLVDRSRLKALLQERSFAEKGITDNSRTIGKLLGADIVVSGIISLCQYENDTPECKGGRMGFWEIIITGIFVETGEVAFKAIIHHQFCSSSKEKYAYNLSQAENEIYNRLGERLKPILGERRQTPIKTE